MLLLQFAVACTATTDEESIKQRQMQPKMYQHDKNRETIEKSKSAQYLTRFDNLPTFSGHKRDFIDSTININQYKRDTSRDFQ